MPEQPDRTRRPSTERRRRARLAGPAATPFTSRRGARRSSAVLLAVLGFAFVVQVRDTAGQRHLLRPARERPDRGAQRPDRHRRARPARGRSARDARRDELRDENRPEPPRSTRPAAGPDPQHHRRARAGHGPGHAGQDHRVHGPGQRRARCSTPSRSCARPAPRRWSSTTRSASARDSSFEDAVGGIELDGQLLEPPYVLDVIGDPHVLHTRADLLQRADREAADTRRRDGGRRGAGGPRHRERPRPLRDLRMRSPARASSLPAQPHPAPAARRRRSHVYPENLKYTSEHEWVRSPGDAEGSVRVGHHRLRPGRARRHRLRLAARRSASRSPRATPAASWSRPSRSATSTRRSPGRSWRPTRRSTRRPSWSTATPTRPAGCSRSASPTPAQVDALMDAAAYQASLDGLSRRRPDCRAPSCGLIGSNNRQPQPSDEGWASIRRGVSMPFCTACGKQNPDDARFCAQCGTQAARRGRRHAERRRPVGEPPRRSPSGCPTRASPPTASSARSTRPRWTPCPRVTPCSSCSVVRAPAAGSCSTPRSSAPVDTPTARSSSTT